MKAIVIGATGAVGKDLVQHLLNNDAVENVTILVRRDTQKQHPKLTQHIIDFNNPQQWQSMVVGDVLFSTLGTTLKKAGSKDNQWTIDHDYQLYAAKAAKQNGVSKMVLVSSLGANSKSNNFYLRMKGTLDEEIIRLGFASTTIVRPPSLIRKNSDRLGEKVSVKILQCLNKLHLLRTITPVKTEAVAAAMIDASLNQNESLCYLHTKEILNFQ